MLRHVYMVLMIVLKFGHFAVIGIELSQALGMETHSLNSTMQLAQPSSGYLAPKLGSVVSLREFSILLLVSSKQKVLIVPHIMTNKNTSLGAAPLRSGKLFLLTAVS